MDECNGICLTGWDLGMGSGAIAYAHPYCPAHGYYPPPDDVCPNGCELHGDRWWTPEECPEHLPEPEQEN